MHRLGRAAVALVGCSLLLAACGGDGGDSSGRSASTTTTADAYGGNSDAPAVGIDPAIQEQYGAAVESLGLRITRAARYEKLGDQTPKVAGKHLALYVEPTGPATPAQYVERIQPLADVFLPEVFDRFPDLDTMDVCQEPPPDEDAAPAPDPYLQLIATRDQAAGIDWSTASVVDLVAAAVDHPNRLHLGAREPFASSPEWTELRARAVAQASAEG